MAGLKGSTVNEFGELDICDIIAAADGKPIITADEFEAYFDQNKSVDDDIELTIYRKGTTQKIVIR